MKLNLPNRAVAKPATTLAEKISGHKFTLPSKSNSTQTNSKKASSKPKGLQLGKSKPATTSATTSPVETAKPVVKDNAIPEVSDEKYNLVVDAEPTLTTEAAEKFRDMLTMLEENIDNEGELQNVLKGTLSHLQENPEVDAILTPEDRAVFVRACRKSYGITLVAKTTRKAKTTKASAKVDDLMDELADLDFAL